MRRNLPWYGGAGIILVSAMLPESLTDAPHSIHGGPSREEHMHASGTPNRLALEKSPYLLQHANNPVDWYPWGEEAFARAKREDKPIFLSVGYSTCYWCHVMEREVFEDTAIARLMNETFVSIKVDREERPDVDRVYMNAVQALTGGGGWPMSVFLTPELKPFFGGTYFPPTPQHGRPGFPQLVSRIGELWRTDRESLTRSGDQVTGFLRQQALTSAGAGPDEGLLDSCFSSFAAVYDTEYAGFDGGPKFPRPSVFNFLLRYHARTGNDAALRMTLSTLKAMSRGGIYDHVGGGFHRYSVDNRWRVPHFEKMLYDQAQLAASYTEAYQATHDGEYAAVARDILTYVLRRMTHPEGGFTSAEDAESAPRSEAPREKEEGAYYLWTKDEIVSLLGRDRADAYCHRFGVTDTGNAPSDPLGVFRGKNILYAAHTIEETAARFGVPASEMEAGLRESRRLLFDRREERPLPQLDDKVLTAWNGLMISAFARAYQVFHEEPYLEAARRSARFVMKNLMDRKSGTLFRRYRDGEARFAGTLQDYAFFTMGLLDLFEAAFEPEWLQAAMDLAHRQSELMEDGDSGGFFDTPAGDPALLVRTKEDYDGAEPSGNSIAAQNLLRLAQLTGEKRYREQAERTVRSFAARMREHPAVLPEMIAAAGRILSVPKEIVVAGRPGAEDTRELLNEIHSHFVPDKVVVLAGGDGRDSYAGKLPFLEGMKMIDGKATAYICENYACRLPVTDRAGVAQALGAAGAAKHKP